MTNFCKISASISISIASLFLLGSLVAAKHQSKSSKRSIVGDFVLQGLPVGAPIRVDHLSATNKMAVAPPLAAVDANEEQKVAKSSTFTEDKEKRTADGKTSENGTGTRRRRHRHRLHSRARSHIKNGEKFVPAFANENSDKNRRNTLPQEPVRSKSNAINRANRFGYSNFHHKWRIDTGKWVIIFLLLTFTSNNDK